MWFTPYSNKPYKFSLSLLLGGDCWAQHEAYLFVKV